MIDRPPIVGTFEEGSRSPNGLGARGSMSHLFPKKTPGCVVQTDPSDLCIPPMTSTARLAITPPDKLTFEYVGHWFFIQIPQDHDMAMRSGPRNVGFQKSMGVTPESVRQSPLARRDDGASKAVQ